MAEERTAAQIGQYDQAQARASAAIDELLEELQTRAGAVGERQALASVAVDLAGKNTAELAGLLTAAIRLLWAERKAGK